MVAQYTEQVMDGLAVLAAHPEVSEVVLTAGRKIPTAAAYAAWQAELTSTTRANAVVEAIVALTNDYTTTSIWY